MDKGWTPDLLKQHLDEKLADLSHRLDGFPQEYATHAQQDVLRATLEEVRSDHVHRREIEEIKAQLHEAAGRRTTVVAVIGVVATLLAIGVGQILSTALTPAEVSKQIDREAPWNKDRPEVTRRIALLEAQIERQRVEITKIEADLHSHVLLDERRKQ